MAISLYGCKGSKFNGGGWLAIHAPFHYTAPLSHTYCQDAWGGGQGQWNEMVSDVPIYRDFIIHGKKGPDIANRYMQPIIHMDTQLDTLHQTLPWISPIIITIFLSGSEWH